MEHSTSAITSSRNAVIAAVALLAMAIIAPVAVFGILDKLVDKTDAARTIWKAFVHKLYPGIECIHVHRRSGLDHLAFYPGKRLNDA